MIIYAVNVNTGGGKVLLDRLMVHNPFEDTSAAFLDKRYTPPVNYKNKYFTFSIWNRFTAELSLFKYLASEKKNSSVLFFGNLPPYKKPKVKSYLYLQNCYLTGQVPLPNDSLYEWLRNLAECWILKLFYKNVDEIWVQTEWMKELTLKQCPKAVIKLKPFLPSLPEAKPKNQKSYQFLFVGSLSVNKGLEQYIEALKKLEQSLNQQSTNTPITVGIVLNNSDTHARCIKKSLNSFKKIKVEVFCKLSRNDLFRLYEDTQYLVVTTLFESFYLPAYEASHFGCKIIARSDSEFLKNTELTDIHYVSPKNIELDQFITP